MLQVYWFVVAVNALMGSIIVLDKINNNRGEVSQTSSFLHSNTFTLALTIIACILAVASLVAPYGQGGVSTIPLLGDLFPTLITLAGYFVFLTRYIKQNYPDKIENNNLFLAIEENEYYVGIACLLISVVHLLFPAVLFL